MSIVSRIDLAIYVCPHNFESLTCFFKSGNILTASNPIRSNKIRQSLNCSDYNSQWRAGLDHYGRSTTQWRLRLMKPTKP